MGTPTITTSSSSVVVGELVRREVPDWDDEVVSTARFKAFSGQKSDWEPRYVFWRDLILKVARALGVCTVNSAEVKHIWFSRAGLTPLCIDHVLLEMYNNDEIFLKGDLIDPTSGRLYRIIRRLGHMLGISKSSALQGDSGDLLILRTLLEDRAAELIKHLSESHWNANCVVTMEMFQSICKSSDEAFAILSYLCQCGKAQYFSIRMTDFIEGVKVSLVSALVPSLSSLDYNVLQLIWTTERLHQQLAVIDRHWVMSKKSAIVSIKAGNKPAAYRHVRQVKLFSESRDKCASLLDRVEEVISVIADVESTKKVSEAIQIGAQAINENKLSIEEVHQHLQDLDEAVASQKQLDQALESMPIQYAEIEDEDLEEEFERLETELGIKDTGIQTPLPVASGKLEKTNHQEPAELLSQSLSKLNLEAA